MIDPRMALEAQERLWALVGREPAGFADRMFCAALPQVQVDLAAVLQALAERTKALEEIAKNEFEGEDPDYGTVLVALHADELSDIARKALTSSDQPQSKGVKT